MLHKNDDNEVETEVETEEVKEGRKNRKEIFRERFVRLPQLSHEMARRD